MTVVDDYAHHPTAIRMTLQTARVTYPSARLWAVWQPHTYSRLRTLFDSFVSAFKPGEVDRVLVTDVFAAREVRGDGPASPEVVAAIQAVSPDLSVQHTPALSDAVEVLINAVQPGDVVLILSAGDAPQVGEQLLRHLADAQPS